MIHKILLVLVFLGNTVLFAQTGTILGKIRDSENKEELSFANVQIEQNGRVVLNATADLNGNFSVSGLVPGVYDLKAACVGYQIQQLNGIIISADKVTQEVVKMAPAVTIMEPVVITTYIKDQLISCRLGRPETMQCFTNSCTVRCICGQYEQCFIDENLFADSLAIEKKVTLQESASCTLFPNPFVQTATIEIVSGAGIADGTVNLFDLSGKEVRKLNFAGRSVVIERKDLAAGSYIYQVNSAGKAIASGKMIIQ